MITSLYSIYELFKMAQQLAITPFKGITNRTKVTTASWSALLHSFYVENYKTTFEHILFNKSTLA